MRMVTCTWLQEAIPAMPHLAWETNSFWCLQHSGKETTTLRKRKGRTVTCSPSREQLMSQEGLAQTRNVGGGGVGPEGGGVFSQKRSGSCQKTDQAVRHDHALIVCTRTQRAAVQSDCGRATTWPCPSAALLPAVTGPPSNCNDSNIAISKQQM